jgi:acyl-CoA synthetase (NDP forming)
MAEAAVAHSPEEAVALASAVGFPVAVKLASRAAVHKTEMGAVRVGLTTPEAVHAAYQEIAERGLEIDAASLEGVLIQRMIQGGVETLVGVTHDPLFGPLVGFGLGGVNVEIWHDVQFRIAPLTDIDADKMIRKIRGFPLLQGYRGRQAVDLDALRELILRMSRLAEEVHEIVELDLNPVMALAAGQGCRVVDARIRVAAHTAG